MKTQAVENNNYSSKRHGCLVPMAKGALTGAAAGFVLKYAYPLTSQEKNTSEYQYVKKELMAKRHTYNSWTEDFVNSIKSNKNLTNAQDAFVKAYDGLKQGDKIGKKRILEAFRKVQKSASSKEEYNAFTAEIERLFKECRSLGINNAKKYMDLYNLATKHIRSTEFFLTAGAITGALITLINHIMKTEVKSH